MPCPPLHINVLSWRVPTNTVRGRMPASVFSETFQHADLHEQSNVFSTPTAPAAPLQWTGSYNARLAGDTVNCINDTILPCPPEVVETLCRMSAACPGSQTTAAMNCTLSHADNVVSGWYSIFPAHTPVCGIPFPAHMFDGITVVETLASESRILDLLKERGALLKKMQAHAATVRCNNVQMRASWGRCRPERGIPLQRKQGWKVVMRKEQLSRYMTIVHTADAGGGAATQIKVSPDAPLDYVPDDTVPNYVDSAPWDPELSDHGFVGLYHQWYTSLSGKRELKLYFVCQSLCQKAGLEIKHLINDIPQTATLSSLAKSEEIWWLRNANSRNRNRLILSFARALDIPVPLAEDHHASEIGVDMAHPSTESLLYALYEHRDGRVGIASECIPTRFVSNGIVCRMAPWEGIYLFGGSPAVTEFGGPFGSEDSVFPLTTIKLDARTEPQARAGHHVIQRASPLQHPDTWYDSQFQIAHSEYVLRRWRRQQQKEQREATSRESVDSIFNADSDSEPPPNDTATSAAPFPGIEDTTLYTIALHAWKVAQMQTADTAATLESERACCDIEHPTAYVSFDSDLVTGKLKSVSWDPQYGVLRLIPLCVCTS